MKDTLYRKTTRFKALLMAVVMLLSVVAPQMTAQAAPNEVPLPAIGIDVSHYQGLIDWNQVAASGVQFAMVRVGYRAQATGILFEDRYARYNLQEAQRVGIEVGAYFFSTAVNEAEAVEEALFTANLLDKYRITFPVVFDCEGFRNATSRQHGLDKAVRTALAVIFLETIAARGYTPMFYANRNEMTDSKDWDMNVLNRYKVWVAQYPSDPFPVTPMSTYAGAQAMWQYTNKAAIPGIGGNVDMDVAYFYYDGFAEPKDASGAEPVSAENAEYIHYVDVLEVVTPTTESLNLRIVANADSPDTIVVPINPGDMLLRTGIGNNGWSRIILNDQVLYASTSYLQKVL